VTSHPTFKAQRFRQHLKGLIRHDARLLAVSAGLVLLIMVLFPFLSWNTAAPLILIAGMVYTSRSFRALNRPTTALDFVMLPITPRERILACWVLSGVLFPALLVAVLALALLIQSGATHALRVGLQVVLNVGQALDPAPGTTPPSLLQGLTYLFHYSVLHAIFLWGSAVFRKSSFLKSALLVLTGLLVLKLVSLAATLCLYIILDRHQVTCSTEEFWASVKYGQAILQIGRICLAALLIPLFVGATHRQLKAMEI